MIAEQSVKAPSPASAIASEAVADGPQPISYGKAIEDLGIRDLLEAGLHFGHQTKRWNPKMKRYIFDKRNGIHIIDLAKSLAMLKEALDFLREVALSGRSILLVGTKKQAQTVVRETATQCGQPYVATRWLGGCMTNSATIRRSVKQLKDLEAIENKDNFASYHKKEAARARRDLTKLRHNLSGIADMVQTPGALFVVDVNREAIAVKEARTLGIPVVAMVDTNCDPDPVDYVIPGNDDAIRAVELIVGCVARVIGKARDEYAKVAAELARKKEEEAKKEAEVKKAAHEARAAEKRKKDEAAAAAKKSAGGEKKPRRAPGKTEAAAESAKPDAKSQTKPKAAENESAKTPAPAKVVAPDAVCADVKAEKADRAEAREQVVTADAEATETVKES